MLEIITPDLTSRKVLGSWYGGYAGSDSWRLSSGITTVETVDDHYLFHNESGSVYECHTSNQGMSVYTTGIYESWLSELPENVSIRIIEDLNENIFW